MAQSQKANNPPTGKRPRGRPRKDGQPAGSVPKTHSSRTTASESGLSDIKAVSSRSKAAAELYYTADAALYDENEDDRAAESDKNPLFDAADDDDDDAAMISQGSSPLQGQAEMDTKGDNESDESEADEEEIDIPPKKKTRKTAPKKSDSDPFPDIAVLRIATPEGNSARREVLCSTDWKDVQKIIHNGMGCEDIPSKPPLSYRLVHWTGKLSSMTLSGQSDWDGCVKDVRAHQSKKKEYAAVEIATTEQYMKSLIAALKKLKKTNSSGFATGQARRKGGKKDKSSGPLLDLLAGGDENADNKGTIDDEGGSTSLMELEKQAGERLRARYGNCQLCGLSVMCKIGLDGAHHRLKHSQTSGWSTALAQRMYGVTLDVPPKSDLFAVFHRNYTNSASSSAAPGKSSILQPSLNSTIPDPVTNVLMAATAALIVKSLGKSPTKSPGGHSSNGADLEYPLISSFMAELHAAHPKRNLDLYADAFHREDLYNIDEIVDMSIPELTADRFGLSFGNAKFLLTKAKSQVRRIRATGL